MNRHQRYDRSERGRARKKRYQARRVRVLGEQIQAPDMETRELMRQLRDDYKESHG